MPMDFRATVRMPTCPIVAMKAKASGTPPKLEATPENDRIAERTQLGKCPRVMAHARKNPMSAPPTALNKLSLIDDQYVPKIKGVLSELILSSVKCPLRS